MNYLELDKKLKEENLDNIYIFHGNEKYMIDSYVKKLKNIFEKKYGTLQNGINYIKINDKNISTLDMEISMPPFGYEKKLIELKDIKICNKANENILEILNNFAKEKNPSSIILICENEMDKRTSSFRKIKDIATEVSFDELSFDMLVSYMTKYFKSNNANIANGTVSFLIEYIGTSLLELLNEADKLIMYSNGSQITPQTIRKLCTKKLDFMIFDLTNAMTRNAKKEEILNIYQGLIDLKEPLALILITLYNHFKKIYKTKIALYDNADIAKILNLKPNQLFLVEKYIKIANTKETFFWSNILKYLQDLDYNYKIGSIDLQIRLDAFIYNFCIN